MGRIAAESEAGKRAFAEANGAIDMYIKEKKGWDQQTQEHAREILLKWMENKTYAVIGKKTAEIDTFVSKNW
jgi:hypothetical protein